MKFRPCIDIHNGQVKQIVGGSLADADNAAKENFVSDKDGAFYAELYKSKGLRGGHVIILNPRGSEYYNADLEQAYSALKTPRISSNGERLTLLSRPMLFGTGGWTLTI